MCWITYYKYTKIYLPESPHFQDGGRNGGGELEMAISQIEKMLQRNFQLIVVPLDMLTNILKIEENTPSGKASFSRWHPKWWPAKLKMAIYLNRKRLFKWFFLDSGTCKYAYEHTNNLGKYTSQKGFIFIMASKMAAGSLEWLYLKWKMLQKNVSTDSGTSIH